MSRATVHLRLHAQLGLCISRRRVSYAHRLALSLYSPTSLFNSIPRSGSSSHRTSWQQPTRRVHTSSVRPASAARPLPTTASLLSETLDRKTRGQASNAGSVGPFPLGISPSQMRSGPPPKKWAELTTGQKVVRSTKNTTNLSVILIGAGLFVLLTYSLTSELFSRNSPTVIYGKACDALNAHPQLAKHLRGPLTFHNNAPSPTRPRHRNRQVPSQLAMDAAGREHLFLHFYVEGKRHGATSTADAEASWTDRTADWFDAQRGALSDLTLDEAQTWVQLHTQALWDSTRSIFRYVSGSAVSEPPPPSETRPVYRDTTIGKRRHDSDWSFAGLFGRLRERMKGGSGSETSVSGSGWVDGEVHADLVKDESGQFVYRYLVVDIPNSNVRNPIRVYVERSHHFQEGERFVSWDAK